MASSCASRLTIPAHAIPEPPDPAPGPIGAPLIARPRGADARSPKRPMNDIGVVSAPSAASRPLAPALPRVLGIELVQRFLERSPRLEQVVSHSRVRDPHDPGDLLGRKTLDLAHDEDGSLPRTEPLRDRLEDVPLLVEHFNERFAKAYGKKAKKFDAEVVEVVQRYSWPGNVRELRNTIERVVIMHQNPKVRIKDLPAFGDAEPPASSYRFPSFKEASDAYHREFIQRKLDEAEGNVSRAAELMGIDRSHLYRRMKALGISAR